MDELALAFIGTIAFIITDDSCRNVPIIMFLVTFLLLVVLGDRDNAVLVGLQEGTIFPNAVTESVKANGIPSHLLDQRRRFGIVVEIAFEFDEFTFTDFPSEVTATL